MSNQLESRPHPLSQHRSDVRSKIVMPIVLPALGLIAFAIILIVAVATGAMVANQVAIIAGILGTVFISLPLMLLCIIPYFLAGATAYFAGWGYAHVRQPIERLRKLTARAAVKADELAPRVSEPVAALNVRVTRWEAELRALQEPSSTVRKENDYE